MRVSAPLEVTVKEPPPLMLPEKVLVPVTAKAVLLSVTLRVPAPASVKVARVWLALLKLTVPLAVRLVALGRLPATLRVAPLLTLAAVETSDPAGPIVSVPLLTVVAPV